MDFSQLSQVKIVEVGPRDGLQNEAMPVAVEHRIELVNRLAAAGFQTIETGSFVSERWIPQMAASDRVFSGIDRLEGTTYSALTPNLKGLEAAIAAGADEVAVFGSASESFSRKNINCSIEESIDRFRPVLVRAQSLGIPVRGYLSCIVDCPYEGSISPAAVYTLTNKLLELGCYEVALSDTTGKATPASMARLLDAITPTIDTTKLALHCHDTYGQALVNILTALDYGISVFDSSVAGLGGCPYAKGASGNVATEDLIFMLDGLGVESGIDLTQVMAAGEFITQVLGCANRSKTGQESSIALLNS